MGEISPAVKRSVGDFSRIPHTPYFCDISPMPEIDRIRALVETEMKAKGFSKRSLSKAAELSESAVRDLLTRTDNPGIGTLRRVAEALA